MSLCEKCSKFKTDSCKLSNRKNFPFKTAKCYERKMNFYEEKLFSILNKTSDTEEAMSLIRDDIIKPLVISSTKITIKNVIEKNDDMWRQAIDLQLNKKQSERVIKAKKRNFLVFCENPIDSFV